MSDTNQTKSWKDVLFKGVPSLNDLGLRFKFQGGSKYLVSRPVVKVPGYEKELLAFPLADNPEVLVIYDGNERVGHTYRDRVEIVQDGIRGRSVAGMILIHTLIDVKFYTRDGKWVGSPSDETMWPEQLAREAILKLYKETHGE